MGATPCTDEEVETLTTKRNTAKSTADTAVEEQTKLKAAATEKYNTANDKLIALNKQIAAQGGSTIPAGTAAPTVATMSGADSGPTTAAGADSGPTTAAGADYGPTTAAGADSGPTTTQSLDSLSDAAGKAKEDAEKASGEIKAADVAIKAADDAASVLDKLDLTKFASDSRFKRQNENSVVAPPGTDVQIDSSSETSNSDNTVPTTCAGVLTLMDDITDTLKTNPAGVTPLITALSAIEKPLATPCTDEEVETLTTKRNTAKSTADTAVEEQTKLKAAATEKYNTANDKLIALNKQIAAQGGSTFPAGTAAPTVPGADSGSGATGA